MVNLTFEPTNIWDGDLIRWHLSLVNNGKRVDRINAHSGAPGAQLLNTGNRDFSGSLRPIPPGRYRLGPVEVAPVSWGPGIGKYWIDLQPMPGTNTHGRSAFGFHADPNFHAPRGRGSAGCIVTHVDRDVQRVVNWCQAKARPVFCDVSHTIPSAQAPNNDQISPLFRAWLDTIAWAEGTDGPNGYRMHFGGSLFNSFRDHPRKVIRAGGFASDAAGRYQFLSTTWDEARERLDLPDFSPHSQDLAAGYLIVVKRKAGTAIEQGDFWAALDLLSWEWASLPASNGKGRYGQPIKTIRQVKEKLDENLARRGLGSI